MAAADGDRRRAALRRGRGHAARTRWSGAAASRLGPVDLQIDWADRVAITGANGAGKSTLLGALLGRLPLDAGQRRARARRRGRRGRPGPRPVPRRRSRCVDAFAARRSRTCVTDADVRTLLAKFGLRADHVLRPAATLSPGERTRAALALLQARGVNLLVLDEPTNHLDLPAIEQLESALATYPGTLLLVTHDRRMLEAVARHPPYRGRQRPRHRSRLTQVPDVHEPRRTRWPPGPGSARGSPAGRAGPERCLHVRPAASEEMLLGHARTGR